ncbi:MAG: leucine-rich repeat domain-containing protein [Eubacterium sp.]|nr:leucine-rich repeat domain-containing protein [Eubacterium sp.]
MRKIALVMAAAIALSNVNVGALQGMNRMYTVSATTREQRVVVNQLFDKTITNNDVTYQFKDGVLTVSGTGIVDNTYRKNVDVNEIKEVVIQSGITAIGNEVFRDLKKLKKITLPSTVTALGFYSLSGLTMDSIVIPSSVKTIGVHCMDKGKIKSVTMPGNFTYNQDCAGSEDWCSTDVLRYTILPKAEKVQLNTEFDPKLMTFFHSAKKVQTVKIDKKYKTYGSCIYTKDGKKLVFVPTSVKNLKIRKGCKTVSLNSFCYSYEPEDWHECFCKNLKTIEVPSTVKTFINDSVRGSEKSPMKRAKFIFHTKKLKGNILSVLSREYKGEGKSKYFTKKYGVKKKDGMFISYDHVLIKYTENKKSVTIPKSVKSIAPYAFSRSLVHTVKIPSNWKKIGDWAFADSKIKNVKMSNKIKTIGEGAFCGSAIKKMILPKKLKTIGNKTFMNTGITKIVIPKTVKKYGAYCLANTKKLKKITLPSNMKYIPKGMFDSSAIESIKIPTGVTKIGNDAFGACKNLTTVQLNKKIKTIGSYSFYGTKKISKMVFPDSVTACGEGCFYYSKISEVVLSKNMKTISNRMFENSKINKVTIPENVTKIGYSAFESTNKLNKVIIPDSVTECGESCFKYSEIKEVTLSKNMKTIPNEMFWGTKISDVTIPGNIKTVGERAFGSHGIGIVPLKRVELQEGVEYICDSSFVNGVATEQSTNQPCTYNTVDVIAPKTLKGVCVTFYNAYAVVDQKVNCTYSYDEKYSNSKRVMVNRTNAVFDLNKVKNGKDLFCRFESNVTRDEDSVWEDKEIRPYHFIFQ